MRLFGYLIAVCLGGQIQFLNVPKGTKIRKDLQLTSQNVLDVHSILTGNEPSHILPHEGLNSHLDFPILVTKFYFLKKNQMRAHVLTKVLV